MKVEAIDHVHIEVGDRNEAADWYTRILGLTRYIPFSEWAASPQGPLFLSTSDGVPALALFHRDRKEVTRDNTIAFRVSGMQFIEFVDKASSLKLTGTRSGEIITGRSDIIDHTYSWSLYFLDPYENRIELTTYDYAEVKKEL